MKMTTRAISEAVSELSSNLCVAISADRVVTNEKIHYEIRFRDVLPRQSFHLVLGRSFRSTSVALKPDYFALQAFEYLLAQVVSEVAQLKSFIEDNKACFSSIDFLLDGKPFDQVATKGDYAPTQLHLEVDVLTETSAIEHGIVSSREFELLRFSIELLLVVLPREFSRFRSPDEVAGFPEGAKTHVMVNRYERDPRNRKKAIEIHGESCMGCGFNFRKKYGEIGSGYIVVHHTVPVSQIGPDYLIDPMNDLVPLCANCHAMVHTRVPPLSIHELRDHLCFDSAKFS